MSPVDIVVIAVAVAALAPTVGSLAIYGGMKLYDKIKKNYKKNKEYRRRHNKKYRERMRRTMEAKRIIEQSRSVAFRNVKNGTMKNVNIKEQIDFDINNDIVLKGKVIVHDPSGKVYSEDPIYLYQPRVEGLNGVPIGPKVDKNGHLYDENAYLLRTPNDPDIYSGYIPRRDVLSGRQFDYVSNSVNTNLGDLEGYLKIEIPKDDKGNFIPLDKNNAKELEEFKQYLGKQKNDSQNDYLDGLISSAYEAKEKYLEANKPIYAKPTETMSEEEVQRVEKARASQAKKEAEKNSYADAIQRGAKADYIRKNYGVPVPGGMPMGPGPRGGAHKTPTPRGRRR